MLDLLFNGQAPLFFLLLIALVISLSFHEFGHALLAKVYGDDTAQRMGRLTLNPLAHIDPVGLLMVVFVGFGYAKPVPTNPRNFTSRWADLWVSAAGPGMNLLLAFLAGNIMVLGLSNGWEMFQSQGVLIFMRYLTGINLLLMLFNLIPLGPLDGHYILPYFLNRRLARIYVDFNAQYGTMVLMGLFLLSFAGIPVFRILMKAADSIIPWLIIF
ncbi:MAG: site-2 protease family protein [Deltaproteobacteria bacterium]|nr:site-2 protease family protein [Deltaproteobacteria bacterium]